MHEESTPPVTELDRSAGGVQLQILKALIPFMPSGSQRALAVMIKFMELKNVLSYYSRTPAMEACQAAPPMDFSTVLESIRGYLPADRQEALDQALSMMQTMELMKELQNAPGQEDFMNAMFGAFQAQDPEGEPNAPTGSKEGSHPERRRDDRRELDEQSEPEAY